MEKVERLWSLQEVADYLGIPIMTLYHWRSRGEGPVGMKIGRHVRYDPDAVRAWCDEQRDHRPVG